MIEPKKRNLSVARQCELVGMSRSSWYYRPRGESERNVALMRVIDELYLEMPWYGSRQMTRELRRAGHRGRPEARPSPDATHGPAIGRSEALHVPAAPPDTSCTRLLLGDIRVTRGNQAWCADLTYIPMAHGFLYVVAIMDWHSRKGPSLATVEHARHCVLRRSSRRSYRTVRPVRKSSTRTRGASSPAPLGRSVLKHHGVRISMDGKGQWMDNVFIERLWRSLKYECVYLNAFQDFKDTDLHIRDWMEYYNNRRPPSALGDLTPGEVYDGIEPVPSAA